MNFHILKLVYCKLDFKFQSSDVIESAASYFTLHSFLQQDKSLEPAWSCQELFITSKLSIHLVTVSISLSVSSPSSGCSTVVSSMLSSMVWADSRELNRTAVSSSRLTPPSSACIQKFTSSQKINCESWFTKVVKVNPAPVLTCKNPLEEEKEETTNSASPSELQWKERINCYHQYANLTLAKKKLKTRQFLFFLYLPSSACKLIQPNLL